MIQFHENGKCQVAKVRRKFVSIFRKKNDIIEIFWYDLNNKKIVKSVNLSQCFPLPNPFIGKGVSLKFVFFLLIALAICLEIFLSSWQWIIKVNLNRI